MGRNSIRIGKFFGIEVAIDYSWFIIFALVAWSVGSHYFLVYGDWPLVVKIATALVTALFFFISIVVHELGHSLVAVRTGIPVKRITLFIFGGMAQINREPAKPSHEFFMALVGPLTSVVLAGFFYLVGLVGRAAGAAVVEAFGGWLAEVNLFLALFNLLPGFPLDGGRVFRAIVWAITKNQARATRIAAVIGRIIAWGFIFLGIWQVFAGNWADGIWIAFIGWFLDSAARQNAQQEAIAGMLKGHAAREAVLADCAPVGPNLPLDRLVGEIIIPTGRRCLPVMDGERFLGLVTVERLKDVKREDWATTPAAAAMVPAAELVSIGPEDDLSEVMMLLLEKETGQAAVLDERGAFLGLVTREGIVNFVRIRSELRQ
jgi:Zn-dependent protease/CBS domain-containing protein